MTQAIKVVRKMPQGLMLSFGEFEFHVRNTRVARAMIRDGRPVWSCRPRSHGLAVVSLVDGASSDLTDRYMIDMKADAERVPGLSLSHTVQTMSRLYMYRLEEWVRGCQA